MPNNYDEMRQDSLANSLGKVGNFGFGIHKVCQKGRAHGTDDRDRLKKCCVDFIAYIQQPVHTMGKVAKESQNLAHILYGRPFLAGWVTLAPINEEFDGNGPRCF